MVCGKCGANVGDDAKRQIPLTALERSLFDQFTLKKPSPEPDLPDAHSVWLVVAQQAFTLGVTVETADDADWVRAMLAKALAKIVAQVQA